MTQTRAAYSLLLSALVLVAPCPAAADWVPPPEVEFTYNVVADSATGKVRVWCYDGRTRYVDASTCATHGGVVREEVDTGEVATLPCYVDANANAADDPTLTVDSCVPPGRYRYGLKVPIHTCGAPLWVEVSVKTVPAGCKPEPGAPGASKLAGPPPWAGQGPRNASCYQDSGCSCSSSQVNGAVFGAQGLALAIGLLLWRRRSRR